MRPVSPNAESVRLSENLSTLFLYGNSIIFADFVSAYGIQLVLFIKSVCVFVPSALVNSSGFVRDVLNSFSQAPLK